MIAPTSRAAPRTRRRSRIDRACDPCVQLLEQRLLFSGLVAAYGFNEGAGSVLTDSSGLGNNGTISNATWVTTGKYGGALSFNGTNSWVTVNDSASLRLTGAMTLEAWVSPKSLAGWEAVIMKERPAGLCYALYSSDNTSKPPAGYINTGGSDLHATGTANLALNAWSFLSVTYSGSKLSLYVNGALVKSTSATGNIVTSSGALRIGGDSVWGEYFNGLIDEIRVYNLALTQTQIQTDMSTPVTPPVDTTPPTVTGESPAPNATNVATNTAISATFSESIQPATLAFTVTDSSSNSVAGTVSYSDASHTATFTPASALAGGMTYAVTVSGAKDLAGNTMSVPFSWSFTTQAPDTTPPTVVSETPAANTHSAPVNTTITATFSESIQPATLSFSVVDTSNNPVAGTVSYTDVNHTATFTPSNSLVASTNYTASISGAKDLAGNAMTGPFAWSFGTADAVSPLSYTGQTPAPGATNVPVTTTVTVSFSESIQPALLSFVLRDQDSALVASTWSYNDPTHTATLTPSAPLASGFSYTATVSGATDLAGNIVDHTSWSFTTTPPGTGPFSVWGSSVVPAVQDDPDGTSNELGVKFRSDVSGYVTGLRFYKGPTNTGVHVGHLWTDTGTLLGTATFTNETATGWQQVLFAQPVAIQANTVYVASYFAPNGHYAEDDGYFANTGVDNAPLHALKAGVDGADGVYLPTSSGAFPTQNWQSANYYVDVVFNSTLPTGPTVTSETPAPGSTGASINTTVSATFSESVQAATISFVLKDASLNPVSGTVVYNDSTHTAAFTPTSTLVSSSAYTATVRGATDASGASMASPVTWSFTTASPATDPSLVGQWSAVNSWPLVAINMVLMHNGKVLMWDGGPACIGWSSATVWDPATGVFTSVPVANPNDNNDIFCSGNVVLADGRVAVVGGHDCTAVLLGSSHLNIFDPVTQQWTNGPQMTYARWYPTSTTLPDGRVLTTSGARSTNDDYVPIPEVYDPVANTWTKLSNANFTMTNYPFMFVLPDGRVLEAGSDEGDLVTEVLDVAKQTWSVVDPVAVDGSSAVMYRPGMILKAGASSPLNAVDSAPSAATAYVLDMTQASPHWKQTASMANARTWLDLTMLPDGNVLATGGGRDLGGVNPATAVYPAEQWSPTTQTWTTLASMQTPRLYHSTALLLPDGRVLVAGGGHNYVNNNDYYSSEIYSPPYLFKGARPTITSAPGTVQYGSNFTIQTPDASNIASVSLVRPGAVTHAFDEDQRFLPLSFTPGSGSLTIQAPGNANLAPPGYYMLFIVNKQGVPSVASFVQLPSGFQDTQPPTAPATLTATGGYGSVSLSWGASSDNVGVTGYTIYRSTTAGFSPSAANQIGTTSGLSSTDTSLPPGTYYYLVTASDAAGNVSQPSNQASATSLSDTVAPTVALTAPAAGAAVSNTVTVSATASDNIGVVGVQFQLDGVNLGAEVTAAPYAISWATTSATNGSHVLTAIARDAAGNKTTSAPVSVTVSNTSTGLVAAYNFNEGSGTALIDRSGNGNNGTMANATWVAGKYGGGLQFNGTSSLVTVASSSSLNLTTGMTLEAWVDPTTLTSPDANWSAVIAKEHLNSSNDVSYALYAGQGTNTPPGGNILVGSATYGTSGGSVLSTNAWVFLAATYDGTTLKTYVNGVLIGSTTIAGKIFATGDPLTIGGDSSNEMFTGIIDNIRVYSTALTQTQLQQDMNAAV